MIPIEELKHGKFTAILIAGTLLMIPIEELKLKKSELARLGLRLLMIPIEELKHKIEQFNVPAVIAFDDTY